MCTRHSDCSNSLGSLSSNRKYCCGGTFCCTLEQYNQGLTSDPFLSSTGALVGIVVGITAFCLVVGIVVWCWFKNSKKQNRIRKQRARQLERATYPGPYAEGSLPGYSTYPRPYPREPHEYEYPPESNVSLPREPRDPSRHFDDVRRPDYNHTRPHYEEHGYHHSTRTGNARRSERSPRPYRTGIVEYLPYQSPPLRHSDYRDYRREDRRHEQRDQQGNKQHERNNKEAGYSQFAVTILTSSVDPDISLGEGTYGQTTVPVLDEKPDCPNFEAPGAK